jgi:hypothetical protein
MADEIETLLVAVRADTRLFASDVAAMKAELAGPFAAGAEQAGRMLENALVRALRTGKLGFDDLKRVALSAMAEIAGAAIRGGFDSLFGKGGIGGLVASLGRKDRQSGHLDRRWVAVHGAGSGHERLGH